MDPLLLTGAFCASAQIHAFTRTRMGTGEAGYFPFPGDVRLTIRLDTSVYRLPEGPERCQGVCVLSVFDGAVWRPFDIASITTVFKFKSPDQLQGLERWLRHAIAVNVARGLHWRPASAEGVPGRYFLPASSPTRVPEAEPSAV